MKDEEKNFHAKSRKDAKKKSKNVATRVAESQRNIKKIIMLCAFVPLWQKISVFAMRSRESLKILPVSKRTQFWCVENDTITQF